jgi:hypothetical protein
LRDLQEPINSQKKPSSTKPEALLKPGLSISLVIDTNIIREIHDIRTSTLHDIIGKKLIIAQPDPALSAIRLNKALTISFLNVEGGKPVRYGFRARIVEFVKEYQLSSSQKASAIVFQQQTIPEHYNLRMFYRIQPPSNSGFQISIYDQPMGIINISIGGALISATRSQNIEFNFETGQTIKVTLTLDNHQYNLKAQIKRISYPENQRRSNYLVFIAIQFENRTLELDRILGGKILDVQRELHSKGLEP